MMMMNFLFVSNHLFGATKQNRNNDMIGREINRDENRFQRSKVKKKAKQKTLYKYGRNRENFLV